MTGATRLRSLATRLHQQATRLPYGPDVDLMTLWTRLPLASQRLAAIRAAAAVLREVLVVADDLAWMLAARLVEEGMTHAEVAHLMGVTRQAVSKRLAVPKPLLPTDVDPDVVDADEVELVEDDDDLDIVLTVTPPPGVPWEAIVLALRGREALRARLRDALTGPLPIEPPGRN